MDFSILFPFFFFYNFTLFLFFFLFNINNFSGLKEDIYNGELVPGMLQEARHRAGNFQPAQERGLKRKSELKNLVIAK